MARVSVLIVGGYGVFGGRLARLLRDDERLRVMVAGRRIKRSEAFCRRWRGAAEMVPCHFDRDGDLGKQLEAIRPDIVVDATGPFQDFVDDPYKVVRAAIDTGCGYLDLADGRAFVAGIGVLDDAARRRRTFVLSGVSTSPALTAAVVRKLSQGLEHVEKVRIGIAPSPHTPIGASVMKAIAGYAGKAVRLRYQGRDAERHALIASMRRTIAPPGCLPLDNTRFSLVDVAEYDLFEAAYPNLRELWFGAGTRPEIWQWALTCCAWLVRWRALPGLGSFSDLFAWVRKRACWGAHRGGMFVEVDGRASDGRSIRSAWHLLAEGDDGPFVPVAAAAAIIRKVARGDTPGAGARAADRELALADILAVLEPLAVQTGCRVIEGDGTDQSVYRRVLGDAWYRLPTQIQAMHRDVGKFSVAGRAEVERGKSVLSRPVGWVMGFPPAGRDVPVRVSFDATREREIWVREFGACRFQSTHSEGTGRSAYLIDERFGPVVISLGLDVRPGRLYLIPKRWRVFGIAMPRFLMPYGDAFEAVDAQGRFRFDVDIRVPLLGRLVRYRGYLEPVSQG